MMRQAVFDMLALEEDAALGHARRIQADETGNRAQRGGFSRAIGPENGHHLAARDRERDAAQRADCTFVDNFDAMHGKERFAVHVGKAGFAAWRLRAVIRRAMAITPPGSITRNRIITRPKAA